MNSENFTTQIGGISSGGGGDTVDDVRVYSRALTAAEVKQLYQLGGVKIKQ